MIRCKKFFSKELLKRKIFSTVSTQVQILSEGKLRGECLSTNVAVGERF
jgi:hypothetical protein